MIKRFKDYFDKKKTDRNIEKFIGDMKALGLNHHNIKKRSDVTNIEVGTGSGEDIPYHDPYSKHSGMFFGIDHAKKKIYVHDIGLHKKDQNTGKARKMIDGIVKHFPKHDIHVDSDHSDGFWNHMKKTHPIIIDG